MEFIKKIIPENVLKIIRPIWHGWLAFLANWYYGKPSEKLVVVGVTGTAGKSTTVAMLAHILNSTGKKCGYITTVNFFDGKNNFLNKHGLSMAGGPVLQKSLKQILDNGCGYAVVECTSEGLQQNRHLGINFDVVLFTNLTRAHLESHGSFGNYQEAKGKLFDVLSRHGRKTFFSQKLMGVNLDDPISGYFLGFPADVKFGVSFTNIKVANLNKVFFAQNLQTRPNLEFKIDQTKFELSILGEFNLKNAALAAVSAEMLGVDLDKSAKSLSSFMGVRGRMESVPTGSNFTVIVDYGCEPASFKAALETTAQLPHNRLIHVFGSTGGHRDKEKRFEFGKSSAQFADYIIVTNDDVYESDPSEIALNIEEGIKTFKLRQPPYEIILERKTAIAKALEMATKDDVILITGKGSEQFLVLPGNKRIEWDEVSVVKELLGKFAKAS